MRRWRQLLALGLLVHCAVATGAAAEPVACAIRVAARPGKSAASAALASSLPQPPLASRPLLAAGGSGAAGPASTHPFAVWQVLTFESAAALAAALPVLRGHPDVLDVEPLRRLSLCEGTGAVATIAGNTPAATHEIPWNVERVGAPAALAAVVPDSSLIVAVIDTGADLLHPDLVRRLWRNDDPPGNANPADDAHDQNGDGFVEEWEQCDDDDNGYVDDEHGFDFTDAPGQGGTGDTLARDSLPDDENGHGTHVAGIIAADGRLRGVAPFVRLMPVRAAFNRFFGPGALETDDAAAAIVYAVDNGARVINLSWGDREESVLIRAAIDYAVAHDVVVVAAVGNGGSAGPHYPSGDPRVLGVTASDRSGARAAFSNLGAAAGVAIAAPGEEAPFPGAGIRSLLPLRLDDDGTRDGIGERRGTSMAAPHVAGLAAIVLCRVDRPDAERTRALLVAAARRAGALDWSADLGHGEADGLRAVETADDLTVAVLGPAPPYRDQRFTLVGTVLSGDVPRRSLLVSHPATGTTQTLVASVVGQVVADTLVAADMSALPEGDWEYTLHVRTADGRERERHGAFRLDRTPPVVDTLVVQSGWRGSEPRWLVSLQSDDAVRVRVVARGDTAPLLADAGFSGRVQLEGPPVPGDSAWIVTLENASGGVLAVAHARPPQLPPWPALDAIEPLDTVLDFFPTAVWGESPAGPVVWGRAPAGAGFTMQAFAVVGNRLVPAYAAGRDGYPRGYADVNGDGAADLLFQSVAGDPAGVTWLMTRGADLFPDSIAVTQPELRALGLYPLDLDAPFEAILARDDRLLLFDDGAGRVPAFRQSLDNPLQTGFNTWGGDAVAGDLDADGRIEFACGDAEGFVCMYERQSDGAFALERRFDTGGTYAYDLTALPEGGILAGAQQTSDPTGDGFQTAVYAFAAYGAGSDSRYPFLSPANSLDAGSALAVSPVTHATWLALVHGKDLYLARGEAEPRARRTHADIAAGDPPVFADLDADGELEMLLRTPRGAALYRLREDSMRPHGLHSESLGADRLRLTWVPGPQGTSRVERRAPGEAWRELGTTSGNTWIDSLLVPFAAHHYRIADVATDGTSSPSNAIVALAQPLPRLLAVEVHGDAALRLRASNALHPLTLAPWRFHVRTGESERRVQQLTVAEDGRVVDLWLDAPLLCDSVDVCADSLRDRQWGLLEAAAACVAGQRHCPAAAFFVVAAGARAGGVEIEWSRAPDARSLDIATYELTWNGSALPILGVERVDSVRTRLELPPESPLVGRGIPYLLRVVGPVRAESDAAPLHAAATVHRVYVEGTGATAVFPVPNPARGPEVVFAEAAADTRIEIFNLEGIRVQELRDPLGGGLRWDLRAADGAPVASGVYIYVVRDGRGTSRGRLAVLR